MYTCILYSVITATAHQTHPSLFLQHHLCSANTINQERGSTSNMPSEACTHKNRWARWKPIAVHEWGLPNVPANKIILYK